MTDLRVTSRQRKKGMMRLRSLLRHACGTHMHDHNAPLQAVATFLGHAKLSTAQISLASQSGRMMQTYRAAYPHVR
jgi:integrase/recombinase XerD